MLIQGHKSQHLKSGKDVKKKEKKKERSGAERRKCQIGHKVWSAPFEVGFSTQPKKAAERGSRANNVKV